MNRRSGRSDSEPRLHQPKARLVDVAGLAGVSLGSASRALSTPHLVKPLTLKRVRDAADQLGYVPNGAARALVLGRSHTVGVVLPTINNPIYSDFVHALQKRLSMDHYQLLISAHEYDRAVEKHLLEQLLHRGVDGVVLVGVDHDASVVEQFERTQRPVLLTWSVDEAGDRASIGFSNRLAIKPIVRHLLRLGHVRFAVLSGYPLENERARARLTGIQEALSAAGLCLNDASVVLGPFSVDAGRTGLRQVLKQVPRPTALICTTDLIAAGAIAEAQRLGMQVPEHLSVTGFDDIELAELITPSLTTVRVPTDTLGVLAAEHLLEALKSGQGLKSASVKTRLVIRQSSGPPPAIS